MTIFAVINQKGGVGKTTCTINLARAAALRGMRTLAIDADPQGNLSSILAKDDLAADQMTFADILVGEKVADVSVPAIWSSIDLVPGNANTLKAIKEIASDHGREYRLREAVEEIREAYDIILIDCAPSLDLHTVNALTAANRGVVITEPARFSVDGLAQLAETFASVQRYYNPLLTVAGLIVNRSRATVAHREWLADLQEASPWPILEPAVPLWSVIQDAAEAGLGLDEWRPDPDKARDASEIFRRYLETLEGRKEQSWRGLNERRALSAIVTPWTDRKKR